MKRILIYAILSLITLGTSAQLFIQGAHSQLPYDEDGKVILFSKIDNSCEIHFKSISPHVNVRWFTFGDGIKKELTDFSKLSDTETYIDPKNNAGYIVSVDGNETFFWVFDLRKESNLLNLICQNPSGKQFPLDEIKEKKHNISNQSNLPSSIKQDFYEEPVMEEIGCKISTTTLARDSTNENQRPSNTTLEGSAPLRIDFYSNPTGNVQNYLWQIYKDGSLIITRNEQDHQYTFTETGKYKIRLRVSNAQKTASDSLDISVSESNISVPKVFTPNGDGNNDEFRVAYTSIVEFNATVVNRWGRSVYKWSNPQTGWDGTIGGKPAPTGTYFYIIRAKGSDGRNYQLKGHINLLR
ncbi:MAG: gliding motility-associated C-terminal domain-containing protein [Paludibacteraceae bacterium]